MDISFSEMKEKEIINVFDGRKLGHVVDILFDVANGTVQGFFVPGEKKFLKRSEDVFVPLDKIKKIGDDVILVKLQVVGENFKSSRNEQRLYDSYMMGNSYNSYNEMKNNSRQIIRNCGGAQNNVAVQNKSFDKIYNLFI